MIAYLSGAMEHAEDEGAGWRQELANWLKNQLNHDSIDPVKASQEIIETYKIGDYRSWKTSDPERFRLFVRHMIDYDLNAVIKQSDYVICLWNQDVLSGGGTHGEVTVAYEHDIPVYLVIDMSLEDVSGWILGCSSQYFFSMDEVKAHLKKLYASPPKK